MMRVTQWLKNRIAFWLLTNKSFKFFRTFGVHVTPVHFYSPVPDLRDLSAIPGFWGREFAMTGVDLQEKSQQSFLETVVSCYRAECGFPRKPTSNPHDYYSENSYFGFASAAAMHAAVRHFRPRTIIEVGTGHSTKVLAGAACLNAAEGVTTELVAIDPYPNRDLLSELPGMKQVIAKKVQEVDLQLFATLQHNDILSIDTSHAVKVGGDVVFLYLEVLPRLPGGVIVHIHDIFLPLDYPQAWLEQRYFWNEQYLLHAFLIFNQQFEVVWGQKFSELRFPELYHEAFAGRTEGAENFNSHSFWL